MNPLEEKIFIEEFTKSVKAILTNSMNPLTIKQIAKILIMWGWPGSETNSLFIKDIQFVVDKIKKETYYK